MYKAGHTFTYLLRGRRRAALAPDLRVVRTGPVCCEPRHGRVTGDQTRTLSGDPAAVGTQRRQSDKLSYKTALPPDPRTWDP